MRTRVFAFLLSAAVVLISASGARGQALMTGRMGVGIRGAYLLPGEDDKLDSSFGFEGLLVYSLAENFSAELAAGHIRPEIFADELEGDARITYLNLTLQLRGEPAPDVGVYLGLGPSLLLNKWSGDNGIRGRDDLGFHLGAGVDYFLTENFVFNLDIKHLWADYKFRRREGAGGKISADGWLMGAGLKFFF